ncbi:ATP-binding protein [Pleurocapsales cyanobacterium LEGE 06147]|nr:ATP-binding protein [Pleurocapsales cyanobacterium LEGE 06147]
MILFEAIIFIGLQASGKSSFYREKFFNTHIRINLDMLKTRHREKILFQACLEAKQSFVIDNTNPTPEDRKRYIIPAKSNNFRLIGYYFQSNLENCKQRNEKRHPQQIVPLVGILATYKKLIKPNYQEGYDALYYVKFGTNYSFIVEEWREKSR